MAVRHREVFPVKERYFISFNIYGRPWEDLLARINNIGINPTNKYQYCSFYLDGNDPRLERVLKWIEDAGINPDRSVRREIVYSKADLKAADLLWLWVTTAERGSPQAHTAYDRSKGCLRCGTGSEQVGPLRMRADDLPKRALVGQSYTGEEFITDELASLITEVVGPLADLRQVENVRERMPLPWWQILPTRRLPAFGSATLGVKRSEPCPACKRDGYFHETQTPFQPAYHRSDFRDLQAWPRAEGAAPPDFACTNEHFGNSFLNPENDPDRCVVYAQPLVMVSNRVMRVFLDRQVKGVEFVPVRLVG